MTAPTPPEQRDQPVEPYGVRPADVHALVQDLRITDEPVEDQYPDDSSQVTVATLKSWIEQVSAAAGAGLWQAVRITDGTRIDLINKAAAAAVVCGVASYAEAATHPRRVDGPTDGGYAAVLWARYESQLDALAARIAGWVTAGGPDVTPETPSQGGVGYQFPAARFPDSVRW